VSIDGTGDWWTGTEYADIERYLVQIEPGGHPVNRVIQARCSCGSTTFAVHVDQVNARTKTICTSCERQAFVSNSEAYWSESKAVRVNCPCRKAEYEVGLGLCIPDRTRVRWMSLGLRCTACQTLGSPLDWKSDLALTDPAATRIG
jgi:hypothetical protein